MGGASCVSVSGNSVGVKKSSREKKVGSLRNGHKWRAPEGEALTIIAGLIDQPGDSKQPGQGVSLRVEA